MAKLIYLDGKLVKTEDASVSLFDHGLLYGDGVFEGIRCYSGNIFKLEEHVARLYRSAKSLGITIPMSHEAMMDAHVKTVAANGLKDAYIRTVVTRGAGDLGLDPRKCPKPTIFIIADTISLFPPEMYEKGIKLITSAVRRTKVDALNAQVKSCNYLSNIHAKIQAIQAGVMECLMLNDEGHVAEGTGDNVFIIRGGVLMTPPGSAGILEGITRDTVMDIAKGFGIPVSVQNLTLHDFYVADEAFLTGTAAEVMPIIDLDTRPIGTGVPGPITVKIIAKFREVAKKLGAKVAYEA